MLKLVVHINMARVTKGSPLLLNRVHSQCTFQDRDTLIIGNIPPLGWKLRRMPIHFVQEPVSLGCMVSSLNKFNPITAKQ